LDGKAGFAWCTLQAFYEYLILLKVDELRETNLESPCPNSLKYPHTEEPVKTVSLKQ
ncbi:MAG: glycosyltransferase family 2 protein, partial [Cyanobacteria bacterium P01_G01_bin.49]